MAPVELGGCRYHPGVGAVLSDDDVERFVADGYVRVEAAFDADLADRCVDTLWSMLGVDRADPAAWSAPVIRIPGAGGPDFVAAINTPRLVGSINDLVGGADAWQRRTQGYGTFAVRFPSDVDPGDAGWHIDGSFGEPPWYRVNFESRGRALLLLMLFSDVTDLDAPTRIKVGSQRDVARALSADIDGDGIAFSPQVHAPRHSTAQPCSPPAEQVTCISAIRSWCMRRAGLATAAGHGSSLSRAFTIARANGSADSTIRTSRTTRRSSEPCGRRSTQLDKRTDRQPAFRDASIDRVPRVHLGGFPALGGPFRGVQEALPRSDRQRRQVR